MAMTATTNTSANTALRYLNQNSSASASALAKLSSGSRIVRASDDAASLAVGTKIKADVTALKQASVNAGQASSLLQVADGGLAQTVDILLRMKALSVQAQSGSVSDNERGFLDREFQALRSQIDSITEQTKFNGTTLLDGSLTAATTANVTAGIDGSGPVSLAIDPTAEAGTYTVAYDEATGELTVSDTNGRSQTVTIDNASNDFTSRIRFTGLDVTLNFAAFDATAAFAGGTFDVAVAGGAMSFQVGVASTDTISINIADIRTQSLGNGTTSLDAATIGTNADAILAGDALDAAIAQLNESRADVGALISRFEFAAANLATTIENMDAARSVLLDVDMAAEMSNFSSKQVLLQASVAMLAQANQQPQQLLKLLG
jgi:flagellin